MYYPNFLKFDIIYGENFPKEIFLINENANINKDESIDYFINVKFLII